MKEIWKDVKNYENLYKISNFGRVKSLKRKGANTRILKQFDNTNGYMIVSLSKNNIQKTYPVHKLVAISFLSNKNHFRDVNHKDGNKKNNNIDNLEWCSHSYNVKHAFKLGLNAPHYKKYNQNARKINQYDLEGKLLKTWDCISDAISGVGISRSSIYRCCVGKFKQSNGYIWEYAD